MFKTHLPAVNKESLIAIVVTIAIVVFFVVDIVVLVPTLLSVYATQSKSVSQEAINTQAVNDALTIIEESK